MKKIFKYKLQQEGRQEIIMPVGAKPLHVAVQHDDVCLWALVDPEVNLVISHSHLWHRS